MNKDFMQYVYNRITTACKESAVYMDLQSKCAKASNDKNTELYEELNCQLEATAEELCYMKGFNDAILLPPSQPDFCLT